MPKFSISNIETKHARNGRRIIIANKKNISNKNSNGIYLVTFLTSTKAFYSELFQ
jgi:hypothetical protein